MNPALVDALRQLQLKPGETITVDVDGRELEIREASAIEDDGYSMLTAPWFPDPPGAIIIQATPGKLDLPDPVIISDEESAPGDLFSDNA